jgi:hypothetical protein
MARSKKQVSDVIIDKTNPLWEALYKKWIAEHRPGYLVSSSGVQYRILQPSDEDIKFVQMAGIENLYSSRSI